MAKTTIAPATMSKATELTSFHVRSELTGFHMRST